MKKLLALFVLLMSLAVLAAACTAPQDQVTPGAGVRLERFDA